MINWLELSKEADDATRPVPDGWYPVFVEDAEGSRSKDKNNPNVKLTLRLAGTVQKNRKMTSYATVSLGSAFAMSKFFNWTRALGVTTDQLQSWTGTGSDAEMDALMVQLAGTAKGRYFWAEMVTQDSNGRPFTGAQNWLALSQAEDQTVRAGGDITGPPAFIGTLDVATSGAAAKPAGAVAVPMPTAMPAPMAAPPARTAMPAPMQNPATTAPAVNTVAPMPTSPDAAPAF